jgi:hypothetical protein
VYKTLINTVLGVGPAPNYLASTPEPAVEHLTALEAEILTVFNRCA